MNQLTPSTGLSGRSLQVQISAVATAFLTSAPTFDFADPGITVTKTTVTGDDSVLVSLTIAPTAKFGPHTLTVTSGDQTLKLISAFTVLPELTAEPLATPPTALQGGVIAFNLRNQDYADNPFLSALGEVLVSSAGLFSSSYFYPNIQTGTTGANRFATALFVDPLAPPGPAVVSIQGHDAFDQPINYYVDPADPSLPQIKARNPTAVTLGTTITAQNFPAIGATNLYSFDNGVANDILFARFTNFGAGFAANDLVFGLTAPASGKFKDGQFLFPVPYMNAGVANTAALGLLSTTGATYVSTLFAGGTGGPTYTHDATFTTIPSVPLSAKEPTMPDTPAKPLAVFNLTKGSAPLATDGDIDSDGDTDYFQYTVSAPGDVFFLVAFKQPEASYFVYAYSDSKCSVPVVVTSGGSSFHDVATAGALSRCFAVRGFGSPSPYSIAFVTQ